jgi:hypothetical protein
MAVWYFLVFHPQPAAALDIRPCAKLCGKCAKLFVDYFRPHFMSIRSAHGKPDPGGNGPRRFKTFFHSLHSINKNILSMQ